MKLFLFTFLSTILICVSCKTDHSPKVDKNESDTPISKNTEIVIKKPELATADTVIVNSMEELVQNAKSNRVLALRNIDYKLDKNSVYYISKDKTRIIDKKVEETRSVGGQVYISGLQNFQIIGQEDTEMITDNEMAIPLYIVKSDYVQIKNIKFRHSDNVKSKLKIPLSYISRSNNLVISNCKFEGKGTYGINLNSVTDLSFVGGEISKCTKGIANITDSRYISFESCELQNNKCGYSAINVSGSNSSVTFNNVTMAYNIGLNDKDSKSKFFNVGKNSVYLTGCTLKGNKNFSSVGLTIGQMRKCELSGMNI